MGMSDASRASEEPSEQPSGDKPGVAQPIAKKRPGKWLIGVILIVLIAVAAILSPFLLGGSKKADDTGTKSGDTRAATRLFDALSKGASQQNIRVAQLRKTYATRADLQKDTDPGFIQSSVAELIDQKFRALYAQRTYDADTFRMQRCMDRTSYIDGLGAAGLSRIPPKTLTEANEYLKQMYQITQNLTFIVCPHAGVMPGGSIDLAPARLSDGLMPVTFSRMQANSWKNKLLEANLFNVKDAGVLTRDGKQVRKLSFTPANDRADSNKRLYDIFYQAGEIEKIKREQPKAEWQFEFISINPAASGSIQGYYLIDESTGLPVYSELQGLGQDRDKSQPSSRGALGYNRQAYSYPRAPTIDLTTPLEFLN
jgi:hypothetical protein